MNAWQSALKCSNQTEIHFGTLISVVGLTQCDSGSVHLSPTPVLSGHGTGVHSDRAQGVIPVVQPDLVGVTAPGEVPVTVSSVAWDQRAVGEIPLPHVALVSLPAAPEVDL